MNCGHCILITRNNIDEDVHLLMKQNDPHTKVKKINKKVNAWTSLFPYAIQQRHVLFLKTKKTTKQKVNACYGSSESFFLNKNRRNKTRTTKGLVGKRGPCRWTYMLIYTYIFVVPCPFPCL